MTTIVVLMASVGRPEFVARHIARLLDQTRPPDHILLSVASEADLPGGIVATDRLSWVIGPKGSCQQRNTGLDLVGDRYDLVAFLDDDYMPSRHAIARMIRFFEAEPGVVGANGQLLADGAGGPGISLGEAGRILADYDQAEAPPLAVGRDLYGLYGCNMVLRADAIGGARFDDRLKLYGWQEDIDFSARLRRRGRLVKTNAFAGVHLGVKQGRTSGIRLGYSQVVNPVYLAAKGTMRRSYAARIIARSFFANHIRAVRPEPWVDRGGRIKGNWIGLIDCLRGRLTPERIEAL